MTKERWRRTSQKVKREEIVLVVRSRIKSGMRRKTWREATREDDDVDKARRARMLQDIAVGRRRKEERERETEHARMYSSRGKVMRAVIAG